MYIFTIYIIIDKMYIECAKGQLGIRAGFIQSALKSDTAGALPWLNEIGRLLLYNLTVDGSYGKRRCGIDVSENTTKSALMPFNK